MLEHAGDEGGGLNFWPSFVDISLITILILIVLYFAQLLANVEVFELARIKDKQDELECRLKEAIASDVGPEALDQVRFSRTFREHRVTFSSGILFHLGEDSLQPAGQRILGSVGRVLREAADDHLFESLQVEGHTDTLRVGRGNVRVRDNWDLASSRATAVVRFFAESTGVAPASVPMSAVGFSKYAPVMGADEFLQKAGFGAGRFQGPAARDSLVTEWMSLNRRVEMKLLYDAGPWAGDEDGYVGCHDSSGNPQPPR